MWTVCVCEPGPSFYELLVCIHVNLLQVYYNLCIYELYRGYIIKIQGRFCPIIQLKLKMC